MKFSEEKYREISEEAVTEIFERYKKYRSYYIEFPVTAMMLAIKRPLYEIREQEMYEKKLLEELNNDLANNIWSVNFEDKYFEKRE